MYFEKQVLLQFRTLPYSSNIKALKRIKKKEVTVLFHQGHQYVVFVPLESLLFLYPLVWTLAREGYQLFFIIGSIVLTLHSALKITNSF
jgi:hypothetical protein